VFIMSARTCAGLLLGVVLVTGCVPADTGPVVSESPAASPAAARLKTGPAESKAEAAETAAAATAPPPDPALVAMYAARPDGERTVPAIDVTAFHRALLRNEVDYPTDEAPGTVVIDTKGPFLYLVEGEGRATRYGIAIGREGFGWTGSGTIQRSARWPRWTPPPEMIERDPSLEKWRDGQPGGVTNPLGARALYIYFGGQDSGFRIHGTNTPKSIGWAASSGCFRMLNQDVIDLYDRVNMGAKVVVI
jgi:lipoprotein-anchoring transpeptidase ErfK/SrfK